MRRELFKYTVRSLQFGILVFLIVAAIYVSIGRIVLSLSDVYRDDLVYWLEERFDVDLKIASINGHWDYFDPEIVLNGVLLGESTSFDHVTFQIGILNSLIERTVVITSIDLRGLKIFLEERSPGKWNIDGFPDSSKFFDPELLLSSLPYLSTAWIDQLEVKLKGIRNDYILSTQDLILQSANNGVRRVSAPLQIRSKDTKFKASITLLGNYSGSQKKKDFEGDFYVDITGTGLEHASYLTEINRRFANISIDSQFWISLNREDKGIVSSIDIEASLLGSDAEKLAVAGDFALDLKVSEDQFKISGNEINIEVDDKAFIIKDLHGALSSNLSQVGFMIPVLDLGQLSSSLLNLGSRVASKKILKAIESISPAGSLRETFVYLDAEKPKSEYQLVSLLDSAEFGSYLGFPKMRNLSGLISMNSDRGFVDIDNEDFYLNFKSHFNEVWPFDAVRGRMLYQNDAEVLRISSGLVEFSHEGLKAFGKVKLNLPRDEGDHTWALLMSVHESKLLESNRYLPNTLSPRLLSWLDAAVIAGEVEESGLLFHGALSKNSPKINKIFESYFRLRDVDLRYHPEWPELSDLNALFYINNAGVFSNNGNAKIHDSNLENAKVNIRIPYGKEAKNFVLSADIKGSLFDGVRVLNETPIADKIMNVSKHWSGTGKLWGTVKLEIPLVPLEDDEIYTDVSISLADNDFSFADQNITIEKINGNFRYESYSGLNSSRFTGNLFGEEIFGSITTELRNQSEEVLVDMEGTIDVIDLYEWSGQPILSRFKGESTYSASLHIPFGNNTEGSYLEATSNLSGIEINLPAPFGKNETTERTLFYREEFLETGSKLNFSLGELSASLLTDNALVTGGRLHVGPTENSEVSYDSLVVTGILEQADYEDWHQFFLDMENISDQSLKSMFRDNSQLISLDIDCLNLYSLPLFGIKANVKRLSGAWSAFLVNEDLSGEIIIPDDGEASVVVNLDRLRFPRAGGATNPLGNLLPQELAGTKFTIKELFYGDEEFGRWSFELRPDETGLSLIDLKGRVKGVSLTEGSRIDWTYDKQSASSFEGNIWIEDLGIALEKWGYASSVEGSNFNLSASLVWDGSPAAIDMAVAEGQIKLLNGKGRFVQADPGAALKLLGVFDFAQIGRRLSFDFSDVVQKGWSFHGIQGSLDYKKGKMSILEPIVIEGSSSTFKLAGSVDLNTRELDNDMIVTLLVSRNLPWYAAYSAIATGPLAGLGVLLAQKILKSQINQASSAKYTVSGTIESPKIELHSLFNNSLGTRTSPIQ
ncbi:MAG: YhdP family protein [Candidatus Azotimanducaceae bacterium]|uniref:YhdP central domain-containing protein n=1 Tax=OM182 bacterium TaxID=2510334 RepID=A0A520S516_9GAMM|nr:MAG: hypothetical protein EVA68_01415 [OM182 bacterium]